jgi:hypothetical protein
MAGSESWELSKSLRLILCRRNAGRKRMVLKTHFFLLAGERKLFLSVEIGFCERLDFGDRGSREPPSVKFQSLVLVRYL